MWGSLRAALGSIPILVSAEKALAYCVFNNPRALFCGTSVLSAAAVNDDISLTQEIHKNI
jgi:hypothetical protein